MAVLTEGRHPGEYLLSEANGVRSRETITLLASQTVVPGTVLGRDAANHYGALNPTAVDGLEQAAGIAFYGAKTAVAETKHVVITARDSEVKAPCLEWPIGITNAQKATALSQLAALGIIVR